jgi:hypothetical protein
VYYGTGPIPPDTTRLRCTCPPHSIYNTSQSDYTKCGGRRLLVVPPTKVGEKCLTSIFMYTCPTLFQRNKGSFIFIFYHMYFIGYIQGYPKSRIKQLVELLPILVEK